MNRSLEYWEYNVLGINPPSLPKLKYIFEFIHGKLSSCVGDYCEFGVFKGASFLSIAYELSSMFPSRTCHGYDSFCGFPGSVANDPRDNFESFDILYRNGRITSEHYEKILRLQKHRKLLKPTDNVSQLNHLQLSTSGRFDVNSGIEDELTRKCRYLNIHKFRFHNVDFTSDGLVKLLPDSIAFCLIDADLYGSYRAVLPLVWERISSGGVIFLDEYYSLKFPGARIATDEFCSVIGAYPSLLGCSGGFERWALLKL